MSGLIPKRRHNSRRFAPSTFESRTNSRLSSITDTSRQGMDGLPDSHFHAMMMCQLCLRTPVSYVSGLNKQRATQVIVRLESPRGRAATVGWTAPDGINVPE